MSEKSQLFLGSVPYGPDIKRLEAAFPVSSLTEGRVVSHEELSGALGLEPMTSRYYGVIKAWQGKMHREFGINLFWQPKEGIRVLNPSEMLGHSETWTRRKIKQTVRAVQLFTRVDRARLNDAGQARLDHQARIAGAMRDALQSAKKELAIEISPVQSLPKRPLSIAGVKTGT